MEWHQLEYFRSIAKTENFRKSAVALSVSQPALSRAIKKLEEELDVTLFNRMGRKVKLNQYGQLFLKRIESSLNNIAVGIQELHHLKDPYSGVVSIAFPQIAGVTILPKILEHFHHQFPNIEIQLFQETILGCIEKVKNREVDLCLIHATEETEHLSWKPLLDEVMYLYVSRKHKLAHLNTIELSKVANEHFIGYKRHLNMSHFMMKLCKEAGFVPSIKFEGEDILTIVGLISAGLGVAIIPEIKGISTEEVKKIKITKPNYRREIGIAWINKEMLSPSAKLLKDFIGELF